nr:hypothetical protein [Actinomycetota bacterium]
MPDDLVGHLIGPTPYSAGWAWMAVGLSLVLVGWYVGVVVVTMPRRRLRTVPLIGAAHDRLVRLRFARAVRAVGDRYRAGQL